MLRIINSHNKKITCPRIEQNLSCNCRNTLECPLDGTCRARNVIYNCVVSAANKPHKVYIGLTEDEWKKRYYNHTKSFRNKNMRKVQRCPVSFGT